MNANAITGTLDKLERTGCCSIAEARELRNSLNELVILADDATHVLKNRDGVRYCRDARCSTGAANTPCMRVARILEMCEQYK